MYYRGSAAAVIVYDITKLVRVTAHFLFPNQNSDIKLNLSDVWDDMFKCPEQQTKSL